MPKQPAHIPLTRPSAPPFSVVAPHLQKVAAGGFWTNAGYVRKLEQRTEKLLGVPQAVAVSSATSGLMLVTRLLGLTGEVIVPSFTFFAGVLPLLWNNLTPVFCDCDPETFNPDPQSIARLITKKTSAIIAVHVFGCPAAVSALTRLAKKHNLRLIFDAAHGFGASYRGKPLGNYGDAEVFSLSPTKLAPAGEGGIITTRSADLAKELKIARDYGNPGDYDCRLVGMNARMSEFNAVFGWVSLQRLPQLAERRRKLAERYKTRLGGLPGLKFQKIPPDCLSSYKDFSILIDPAPECAGAGFTRDDLAAFLAERHIDTRRYFYPPVHRQKVFRKYRRKNQQLPITDYVTDNILSLPLYSHQKTAEIDRVIRTVELCYQKYHGRA
jgi:dTDP-4-amino-4,6-dideoxygalactose transaminase